MSMEHAEIHTHTRRIRSTGKCLKGYETKCAHNGVNGLKEQMFSLMQSQRHTDNSDKKNALLICSLLLAL